MTPDKGNAFHAACSCCGQRWTHIDAFLGDPQVALLGYQPDFSFLPDGLFLFNHHLCHGTFSKEVSAFEPLYTGPRYVECARGTEDCPTRCLKQNDLEPCPARCDCAWVREVMQIIRNRSRPAGTAAY